MNLEALAAPIIELLQGFGSGLMPDGNPAELIKLAGTALDVAHQFGKTGLALAEAIWTGPASANATDMITSVQQATGQLGERATTIAQTAQSAAMDVSQGAQELGRILQSFLATVEAAAPLIALPGTQIALVGSAIEHLGQAVQLVGRVQSQLDTHAGAVNSATGPLAIPAPPAVNEPVPGTSVASVGTMADTANTMFRGLSGSLPGTAPSGLGDAGASFLPSGVPAGGVLVQLPDGSTATAPNARAAAAVREALSVRGTPYVWGGTNPQSGVDCSGLTQWAYRQSGVQIPRLAVDQAVGQRVEAAHLLPGDLAVWDGHVAMVIGNGQLIEAGDPVQVGPIRTSNMGMGFHGFYRPTA